jgi:hypothetical protein
MAANLELADRTPAFFVAASRSPRLESQRLQVIYVANWVL